MFDSGWLNRVMRREGSLKSSVYYLKIKTQNYNGMKTLYVGTFLAKVLSELL